METVEVPHDGQNEQYGVHIESTLGQLTPGQLYRFRR
jgi:hypothetical protein